MSKKVLFTASIPRHFKAFHIPYFKWFKEKGYEVHAACNGDDDIPYVDKIWDIPIQRSPYKYKNHTAYKELRKLIANENYKLIHCHTPMASVITRLASRNARKKGTKVLYTAHGFHFFKGAPLINWLFYYPVEISLTYLTDGLVCINTEDFERIKKIGSKKCNYHLIPGIGVEKKKFFPVDSHSKNELRKAKRLPENKFIIVYAAEFISRKNHKFILQSIKNNLELLDNILFIFAGKGLLKDKLQKLTHDYQIDEYVHFIGFRKDIDEIFKLSDLGVSASKQEGLPINIVEEMMCGIPSIATDVRGHNEIIDHGTNGYLFEENNEEEFIKYIINLKSDKVKHHNFSKNTIKSANKFEISNSLSCMSQIYNEYLK